MRLILSGSHICCCCFSVTQLCPILGDPVDCSTSGLLSLTISWNLPKFMFIASVMPSSRLILWCPLLLLPSIFPIIRDFSSESAVRIRWPKYWKCFGRLKKLEPWEPISPSRVESWGSLAVTTPCCLAWAQPGTGLSLGNQQVLLLPLSETLLLCHH